MATYKLIQDIEADDHILGPLTLRQFIFGMVGAFCWYLSFIIFVKHVYFLLAITGLPALFCTFFAIPFGRDQPTEVWALAKLRFWFKPRQRIWDQSGIKELVTITVPKKVERILTKGFSQSEVESRLKALANTLDSRGWAIKNANIGMYAPSDPSRLGASDRLIDINKVPQDVPSYDVRASDDILDETSNPVAQQFQSMITQSTQEHRKHLIDELNGIRDVQSPASPQTNGWFMSRPAAPVASQGTIAAGPVAPVSSSPSVETTANLQLPAPVSSKPLAYSHMRTLQPNVQQRPAVKPVAARPAPSGTATPDAAILSLANNNDLNVSTLAREAYKAKHDDEPPKDEVVVSLH